MDKVGKGKEWKWGGRKGKKGKEKKEGGRMGGTRIIRSLGPVTGLQLQFWSAFIRMVFNLLFHTVFRS